MAAEVLNKRSDQVQASGIPSVPLASQMKYGELALNYAHDAETIFLKNSNDEIVSFSNDKALINYIDNTATPRVYDESIDFDGGIPYDAEVEYLQGDGAAYIDIGVNCRNVLNIQLEVMYDVLPSAVNVFFGSYFELTSSSLPKLQIGSKDNNVWLTNIAGSPISSSSGITSDGSITANQKYTINFNTISQASDNTLYLFARNNDKGNYLPSTARIYKLIITDNGTIIRDYIPVRKNGVGYLYEKVSKTLFGNAAGTGAFTYGNDKTLEIKQIKFNDIVYPIKDETARTELSTKVSKSGDTMSGNLIFAAGATILDYDVDTSRVRGHLWRNVAKNVVGGIYMHNTTDHIFINSNVNKITGNIWDNTAGQYSLMIGRNELTYNRNKIWHAGNDGSGSTLDADLLDGLHGSYYAKASDIPQYVVCTLHEYNAMESHAQDTYYIILENDADYE